MTYYDISYYYLFSCTCYFTFAYYLTPFFKNDRTLGNVYTIYIQKKYRWGWPGPVSAPPRAAAQPRGAQRHRGSAVQRGRGRRRAHGPTAARMPLGACWGRYPKETGILQQNWSWRFWRGIFVDIIWHDLTKFLAGAGGNKQTKCPHLT